MCCGTADCAVGGARDGYLFRTVTNLIVKITDRQLLLSLSTDKDLHHNMAETDPKSVQDLTNVVSRDRDGKLALATVA